MSVKATDVSRWPRIGFALTVKSGQVDCSYHRVDDYVSGHHVTGAEEAAIWAELAEFYEWRLAQRANELARDASLRYMVEEWTDSMCYSLRRSVAYALGEDPGPVVPRWERLRASQPAVEKPGTKALVA